MKNGSALLNKNAQQVVETMIRDAERLRISVSKGSLGECLVNAGAKIEGSIEAGLRMAQAAMGGLGNITLEMDRSSRYPLNVQVQSSQPGLACLASQYAGWSLATEGYFALGSGPARALACVEPIFADTISYRDESDSAVLLLETDKAPPQDVVEKVAKATGLAPEKLTFLYAPTQSLAGTVQIVARVLEVALHKANDLKFPLENIVDGIGIAPIPAPHPDFMTAMGRTNDAIIYGGTVQLFVKGSAQAARELAEKLPSNSSRDYGAPFAEIFKQFKGDFYAIDPLLFSPAEVIVTAIESGETFRTGEYNLPMLEKSLG